MYFPRLIVREGEIAAAMDDTDNIDLLFVDEPVNDPVTPEEYLADIVAFGFGHGTTTEREIFQSIH